MKTSLKPLIEYAVAMAAVYHKRASLDQLKPYEVAFVKSANAIFAQIDFSGTIHLPRTNKGIERFVESLWPTLKMFSNEYTVEQVEIENLQKAFSSVTANSENATKNVKRVAWFYKNGLDNLWTDRHEELDNSHLHDKATKLVEQILGEKKPFIGYIDREKVPKTGPKAALNEKYKAINKQATEIWNSAVKQLVAENGGKPVPMKGALNYLKEKGVVRQYVSPDLAKYPLRLGINKITGNPAIFTKTDKLLSVVPGPLTKVTYNHSYSEDNPSKWVFKSTEPGFVSESTAYTPDALAKRADKKSESIETLIPHIDTYVKRWLADAKSDDFEKRVAGTCALIIYLTASRVGSKFGSDSGVGISTTKVKNWRVSPTEIRIRYRGKSDIKQDARITRQSAPFYFDTLRKNLAELLKNKEPNDPVFVKSENSDTALAGLGINAYIRSRGWPSGIGVHKIRHLRGTLLAQKIVEESKLKISRNAKQKGLVAMQREAEAWFKEAVVKKVAALLGHKKAGSTELNISTSIKSYIDPGFVSDYFTGKKLRVPKWVPKVESSDK